MIVVNALLSIIKLFIYITINIFIISVRFFINILSRTIKSTIPYVANYGVFKLFASVVLSIAKLIPQILQIALVFVPSNLKYPFT